MPLFKSVFNNRKSKNRFIFGYLVIISALLFGFFIYHAGLIYNYRDTVDGVHLPETDVLIVLAGGRGRLSFAGDLWVRYAEKFSPPPILYLSGVGPDSTWVTIQESFREGVRTALRPESVYIEKISLNTIENAIEFFTVASAKKWKKGVLVTSSYHMRRAQFIFEKILAERDLDFTLDTWSVVQEPYHQKEWFTQWSSIQTTFLEYLKWVYYSRFMVSQKRY